MTTTRADAFDAFLSAGREGRPGLWRFLLTFAIVAILYLGATMLAFSVGFGVLAGMGGTELIADWYERGAALDEAPFAISAVFLSAALIGLGLTIPALYIGVAGLHRRRFGSIFGAARRLQRSTLAIGAGAAIVGSMISLPIALSLGLMDLAPRELPPGWIWLALALTVLIVFQASAEELVFRGYMLQWLGARLRSPLVWALGPSLGFGLLHYSGDGGPEQWAYVGATILFGLFACALVWRTGGVSCAIGYHVANNIIALVLFDPPVGISGIGYYQIIMDVRDVPVLLALECGMFGLVYLAISAIAPIETPAAPEPVGRAAGDAGPPPTTEAG